MEEDVLYIVIPAYNEEEMIESVAREWHTVVQKAGAGSRLIVINDGSKDSTLEKLLSLKAELPQLEVLNKENSGHGPTVLYGYRYALERLASCKEGYVFQTDSDGQTLPAEFDAFWQKRHDFDVIIGCRKHRKDGFSRVIVAKVLKFVLFCIFRVKVADANTPFRLMKAHILETYIKIIPADFNLPNVLLTVLFKKYKVNMAFLPITFKPRQGGKNSINIKKICKIGLHAVKNFKIINSALVQLGDRE